MKTAAVLALFLASAAAFNAPFATRAVGAKKAPAKKAPAKKAAPVVSFWILCRLLFVYDTIPSN